MCGKKRGIRILEATWWWIEDVEAISRKKDAHKAMCGNSTENSTEERNRYKIIKNETKKAVSKAMREY